MQANLHFKEKKAVQAGNELSNILAKSSRVEKTTTILSDVLIA